MRSVKSRDTTPEIIVRRALWSLGYRYRLHRSDVPGNPDIVFIGQRKAIFVHGCFWHGHDCKRGARAPKANAEYWRSKIQRNRDRDVRHVEDLTDAGWRSLILWECELKDSAALERRLRAFLIE